ncbi:MAG: cysteine synthase A [Ruminococcus sp.]|nr:cysteine synthase A [Ruminococcus sp.]
MKIYEAITELIGNTPLLELKTIELTHSLNVRMLAKLESFNPTCSVKDRIAKAMIQDAEEKSFLSKDSIIIEPTSGNTGIGLAAVAASRGYRIMIVMPENMSAERCDLLKAYGAEIVFTDAEKGMVGAIQKAQELANSIPHSFIPSQFTNPINPITHTETTGIEIWNDTDGQVDILVAGVGTGGTISGVGGYLKACKPEIQVIAVEPEDSPVLSGGKAGIHQIQGIGAGFVPDTLNTEIYDEIIRVSNEDAIDTCRELVRKEGVLAGISSGAALFAAKQIAKRTENNGKMLVVILPDTGERYLTMGIFNT